MHHIVYAPADDFLKGTVLTLTDAGDAIVGIECAGDSGRTTGNDIDDAHVFIRVLQGGTDALIAEAHLDAVFLGVAR